MHYGDADAVVLCYSSAFRPSFDNVKYKWVAEICNQAANSKVKKKTKN